MTDYAGNVLGAIDLIVQERMKDLKFDKTIVCTIIENLGEGVYLVNDGSTNFEAVADILSYPIGFQVNVLVPQGDYNNQKTNKLIFNKPRENKCLNKKRAKHSRNYYQNIQKVAESRRHTFVALEKHSRR